MGEGISAVLGVEKWSELVEGVAMVVREFKRHLGVWGVWK